MMWRKEGIFKAQRHVLGVNDLVKVITIIKANPFCSFKFLFRRLYEFCGSYEQRALKQALIFLEHYGIIKMIKIKEKGEAKTYLYVK